MNKKLKKTQKALPPFGWDTEPVIGSEEVIEEAFIDVFCDLIYGGGWMDLERCEEVDRDCNWALVGHCLASAVWTALMTILSWLGRVQITRAIPNYSHWWLRSSDCHDSHVI